MGYAPTFQSAKLQLFPEMVRKKRHRVPTLRDNARPPIVIVIVIGCLLVPLFFCKSGTLIFAFWGITIGNFYLSRIRESVNYIF